MTDLMVKASLRKYQVLNFSPVADILNYLVHCIVSNVILRKNNLLNFNTTMVLFENFRKPMNPVPGNLVLL